MNRSRVKRGVWFAVVTVAVLVGAFAAWVGATAWIAEREMEGQDPRFICLHPKFALLDRGKSKDQVLNLLGEPTRRIVKRSLAEDGFGAGSLERKIKEGWIYEIQGWNGAIEVYFGVDGKVVGRNCGYG